MITRTEPSCQAKPTSNSKDCITLHNNASWQDALATTVRDCRELFALLQLDLKQLPAAIASSRDFALCVPLGFVKKMKKGDWNDPLLRQILPLEQEQHQQPGFSLDPLAETSHNPHSGLIHKYQGRVLLIVSGGCAINCRYCFRRHFPYSQNIPNKNQLQEVLTYIANDSSIKEVILSGGDPLVASDKHLSSLVNSIADIPHVTTLRVHSRLPVVIPERITPQCIRWLTSTHLQTVVVIHCNHANELDDEVKQAIRKLRSAGVTVLNQTVLLLGINDNTQSLINLSENLFSAGVLPYYLHLLDKVKGAAHFDVSEHHAQRLIESMRARLPGYLVPKLVREVPGAKSKTPIYSTINFI